MRAIDHGPRFPGQRRDRHGGYTLVEMLVVIAILGLLMALLIPAVGGVRESARRTQCGNNLKQLGVALQNHAALQQVFPNGSSTTDSGQDWGGSWLTLLLPFLEETAVYQRLNFKTQYAFHPGPAVGGSGPAGVGTNDAVLVDFLPAFLTCPSSPLPRMIAVADWGPTRRGAANYVGIAGAAPDVLRPNRVTAVPVFSGQTACNGVLFPNGVRSNGLEPAAIRDGLSNTFVVGEQSDWIIGTDGSRKDVRASGKYGSFIGCNALPPPPLSPSADWTTHPQPRAFAVTTVRYALNWKSESAGMNNDIGPNSSVQSAHVGGATLLLADGAIRWLADSVSFDVFRVGCIRDDGAGASE